MNDCEEDEHKSWVFDEESQLGGQRRESSYSKSSSLNR